ncbi:MAG: GNAT family N-acetyltransferase [Hyphomicrobiaceae bacterium]
MSGAVPAITFEAVTAAHYGLLRRWLAAPHVARWWGDPEIEFGYIVDMVEGRDTTQPYVIGADGMPVGYIQAWFICDHQNATWLADNPWLTDLPSDAVGVDLAIGEADRLGRGIGSAALRLFAERLATEGHRTIVIDPDTDNRRAIATYTRAGFAPVSHLVGRTGDCLIMQFGLGARRTAG